MISAGVYPSLRTISKPSSTSLETWVTKDLNLSTKPNSSASGPTGLLPSGECGALLEAGEILKPVPVLGILIFSPELLKSASEEFREICPVELGFLKDPVRERVLLSDFLSPDILLDLDCSTSVVDEGFSVSFRDTGAEAGNVVLELIIVWNVGDRTAGVSTTYEGL